MVHRCATRSCAGSTGILVTTPANSWTAFVGGFALLFAAYHLPDVVHATWAPYVAIPLVLVLSDLVARAQRTRGLRAYGLAAHAGWLHNLAIGVGVGVGFALLAHAVVLGLGHERVRAVAPARAWLELAPKILLMTLLPSLAEDLLTRGYLFRFLAPRMAPTTWIGLSALVFVGNHVTRLGDGAPILVYLLAIGLATAWALAFTGSLWTTLGLHWGGNLVYFASISVVRVEATDAGTTALWALAGCDLLMFGFCVGVVGALVRRPGRSAGGVEP